MRPLSEMQAENPTISLRPMVTPLPAAPMSGGVPAPPPGYAQWQSGAVAPAPGFSNTKLVGSPSSWWC